MSADRMTWEQAVVSLRECADHADLVRACFYDDPLLAAAERYHRSTEWQALRSLLPSVDGRALDIGAGRGIASYALASDGWAVTAAEPDPSPVVGAQAIRSLAQASGHPIEVVEHQGEALPFESETFGLVHCRAVLHHARDLSGFCREAVRVLRPGGTLIATREHVISHPKDLDRFLNAHPLHRFYGGETAYMLEEYVQALRNAGLERLQVLNPMESDINLFPDSRAQVKERWARKMGFTRGNLIPDFLLSCIGALSNEPGRHYSFVGTKVSSG
jgi:SAM-dependent methyltransferase